MVESTRESTLRCIVLPGADQLVRERLAKDLHELLAEKLPIAYAPSADQPGSKGTTADIATLVITGAVPVALKQLVALVQVWCERDTRRTVEISDGERTLRVVANPTKGQLQAIERFVGDGPVDSTPDTAS